MAELVVFGDPQPKQAEFFLARSRFVAYGGARGGGKSWAVRVKAALLALQYPGIKLLVVRHTFLELRENHILPMLSLLSPVPGVKYRDIDKAFTFPNGSRIRFGYCDGDADVLQYQGQEFDCVFMDEATQFTEFQYKALTACIRGANDFPKRFYLTCNPGGVGHTWVKRLFVDREYTEYENPDDYTFIPARVEDNRILLEKDPNYVNMLRNQDEDTRKAWLDGDWNVYQGQYFTEFNPALHVIEPFQIPRHWLIFRTFDYGLDMLACLWIAVDEHRQAVVFRELCEPNLTISQAAAAITAHSREPVHLTLAPPDMWNRRQETGRSVADMFSEHGIQLVRSSNDRVSGWQSVHEWLLPVARGNGEQFARLRFFNTCRTLIKHIPMLQHSEKNPDDVSTTPHIITHAPDALRGYCVMWPVGADAPPAPDAERAHTYDDGIREFAEYGRI